MQRNRISNVSFAVCSAGEILILVVMVGILKGLKSDESTENNTKAFSVLIAFSGGVWCMFPPFVLFAQLCYCRCWNTDTLTLYRQCFARYHGS